MSEDKVLTTSCDPEIEHVIYDHSEIVPYCGDVFLKMVYIIKQGYKGKLIGVHACDADGSLIQDGLIVYLQDGLWKRCENLNPYRLHFIKKDSKGRIKIGD